MPGFDAAVELLFSLEGLHSNDVDDPGADTWFGVSRTAHPTLPWPPSKTDALALYRREYWSPAGCESLPPALALAVFDAAVNQGVTTAVVMLQATLGVLADGIVGPKTLAAAQGHEAEHVARYLARRAQRYVATANFQRFGAGWFYRLFRVARACAALTLQEAL